MNTFLISGMVGCVTFIGGIAYGIDLEADKHPVCFEDQVVVWTGEAHDSCANIDEIILSDPESVQELLDNNS